jgi:hypothetical protein
MSGFSASEAALEGFRITRENPRAFAAWVGASFAVSVLAPVITAFLPPGMKHGLETLTATETPTASQLLDTLIVVAPVLVLGLAIQCVMAAAVYRLIFRHDDGRFAYLRVGADELRLMGLTVIYIGLIMALLVAVTMASAIVMALASVAGPAVAGFVGAVTSLFSIGLVIFVLVRLSLAPVATFAEQRLAIFESWGLTRGQFWPLLGAYALALACIAVIGFLIIVVFSGIAGAIMLASYFSIGLIAYMIVSSVFSALYNAVIASPGAVAYKELHGVPPSRPLTIQPEAG